VRSIPFVSINHKMSDGPITGVRTPEFGVCMDKGTLSSDRCVLSQASCDDSGMEIYTSPYETNLSCKAPEDVQVGRCKSSLDDERCGPSEASCGTKSPFYAINDPKCSLVTDKSVGDGTRTTFPTCSNSETSETQCVLDESYCLEGESFTYAKWAEEWGPNLCYCEHVPTGVCYQPKTTAGENNLTPKYSFCAVSQRDCPSDYLWMSARAFLKSDRVTYECRLCDDDDKIGNEGSYPVGGCLETGASSTSFDAASFVNCALESVGCPGTTEFVSFQKLSEQGLYCPMERTKNWGTCTSSGDPVECTNKEASCLYDFRFEADDSVCDVYGHPETGIPTYFSYCSPRTDNDDKDWKDIRCVWGEWECDPAKERWEEARLPNDAWFKGCTCEDVLTGVCKEPSTGEYHCAVSPQACTDPASYVSQRYLKEMEIDMTCQLCPSRPPSAPPIPSLTNSPVPLPTMVQQPVPAPTHSPIVVDRPTLPPIPWPTEPPKTTSTKSQFQNNNLPPGAIAGIAVGGLVVCGLIVLIISMAAGGGTTKSPPLESHPEGDEETDHPEVVIEEPDHNEDLVPSTATIT
jgi:hypothetical protein